MALPVVAGIVFVQRRDLVELEVSLVLVRPRDGGVGDENGSKYAGNWKALLRHGEATLK